MADSLRSVTRRSLRCGLVLVLGVGERRLPSTTIGLYRVAMDPLDVLKKALSSPAGSDDQRTVLAQLRAQLEMQPALIHPLCTMLVSTIVTASDSLMKLWVLDLLHFALSRSTLGVDAKAQRVSQRVVHTTVF